MSGCWFEDVEVGTRFVLEERTLPAPHNPLLLLAQSMGAPFSEMVGQSSRFVHEPCPQDHLFIVLQVVALEPCPSGGVVVLRSTIHNQDRRLLLEGEQHYWLRCRPVEAELSDIVAERDWSGEQTRCDPHARH
jgi:hypothetical protein